jgi:hypothetical protein
MTLPIIELPDWLSHDLERLVARKKATLWNRLIVGIPPAIPFIDWPVYISIYYATSFIYTNIYIDYRRYTIDYSNYISIYDSW